MAVFLTPDKIMTLNGLKVMQYFITEHNVNNIALPSKRKKPIAGVTLHNTEWLYNISSQTTCAEQYTRATVNGNMLDVRVHYYVDDKCAWQNLSWEYQSWHAGSKRKEANGSEAGNAQTISIECIMDGSGKPYDLTARDNSARLIAFILWSNNLTIDNLYTHNYWANVRRGLKGTVDYLNMTDDDHKHCPIFIRPKWLEFKALVSKYLEQLGGNTVNNNIIDKTTTDTTNKKVIYKVQLGAFTIKSNAEKYKHKIQNAGFKDAYITTSTIKGKLYFKVQIGAFSVKSNAIAYRDKAKKLGFTEAIIVTSSS